MTEILQYSFFTYALAGVLLIGISSAMIGTYVIVRRLVAISGGITHACFGGLGLGYFMGWNPIATAAVFAVASGLGVEWFARNLRLRQDSAIAVIWATGMALGVLFVFLTPGYVPELNSFLFGNILTISPTDLMAFGIFTAVLCGFYAWRFRQIVMVAFDPDFAAVCGLPVRAISYTMTILVAVCIVLTIRLVGVMLLMSMLSLPIMTAELFGRRFRGIMFGAIGVSVFCGLCGLLLSTWIDVPCSALIVLLNVLCFALGKGFRSLYR